MAEDWSLKAIQLLFEEKRNYYSHFSTTKVAASSSILVTSGSIECQPEKFSEWMNESVITVAVVVFDVANVA